MMDKTNARRAIKMIASRNMQGNWIKSFLLFIAISVIQMAILSFLPLRLPLQEEIVAAGEDIIKLLMLFLPREITYRTIASYAVTAVLYILVMCPLSVGTCAFFRKIAKGEKARLRDAFSVFANLKTIFGSIWLNFLVLLISSFWVFLFMLVPVAVEVFAIVVESWLLPWLVIVLLIGASILSVLWVSRYSFALYIYAEGNLGPFASLCESIRLMNHRLGECLSLRASYFLWDIVCYFFPPLGFIYSALFQTAYAKYLEYLRGEIFTPSSEAPQQEQ